MVRQVRGNIPAERLHQPNQKFKRNGCQPAKKTDEYTAINQEVPLAVLTHAPPGNFIRKGFYHFVRESIEGFFCVKTNMQYICP